MELLEARIARDGVVLGGDILKVGSFLNQQIDVDFLMQLGEEMARLYAQDKVTKILTIEASGIAVAVAAAAYLHVPVVLPKKAEAPTSRRTFTVRELRPLLIKILMRQLWRRNIFAIKIVCCL